jgi:hypothetical protein
MSSETSTESPASGSESLQPWQLFTLAGLLGATLVVFLARGQSPAAVIILSLLVFAAAAVGVAAIKTFVSLTGSGTVLTTQVLGGRTRAALEREKTLVLRSIKELEFDRAMGKVSEKDFAEMSGRLRARAAGLIRQLDAGTSYRQQIEKEVARRISSKVGRSTTVAGSTAVGGSIEQDPPYAAELLCASCNTANDADARFCKSCGSRLESGS